MNSKKRILIAAVKSGSGKTLFTCGLLELLKHMYPSVRSHKCGPDYIDPMFHRSVLGIEGTNLDPFFSDEADLNKTLAEEQADMTVIEGAMGIYDGITGMGKTGSCYDVARKTNTPVLLLVDAAGSGATILSVVKGILIDDEAHLIKGIVFNRMSDAYLETLKPDIAEMLVQTGRDVQVLGAIPKAKDIQFESRHLGLVMPEEVEDLLTHIRAFADLIREHIDLQALDAIAAGAANPDLADKPVSVQQRGLKIGVARDEAFCFYYEQNLKALENRGIEICYFSPLKDSCLPEGISGLLLGGGYPELFLKELSENTAMRKEIRNAVDAGMPSLAECGGFMYLSEYIRGEDGKDYPMVGAVKGGAVNNGRLTRFGYVTVMPETEGLLKKPVRGHEFHYYDMENNGSGCRAEKPGTGRSWNCMQMGKEHLWGYPHLYYPSCPELLDAFVGQMEQYSRS